jgi:hypothetical protein
MAMRTIATPLVLLSLISTARSVTQTMAMTAVGRGAYMAGWVTGAMWDPGSCE